MVAACATDNPNNNDAMGSKRLKVTGLLGFMSDNPES